MLVKDLLIEIENICNNKSLSSSMADVPKILEKKYPEFNYYYATYDENLNIYTISGMNNFFTVFIDDIHMNRNESIKLLSTDVSVIYDNKTNHARVLKILFKLESSFYFDFNENEVTICCKKKNTPYMFEMGIIPNENLNSIINNAKFEELIGKNPVASVTLLKNMKIPSYKEALKNVYVQCFIKNILKIKAKLVENLLFIDGGEKIINIVENPKYLIDNFDCLELELMANKTFCQYASSLFDAFFANNYEKDAKF